jgi:hypothetical protein
MLLMCRLLGHRFHFTSEGKTMRWNCGRKGCGASDAKCYPSAAEAAKFAAAFDVEDRQELGRRAPFGLLPLRLWNSWRRRKGGSPRH